MLLYQIRGLNIFLGARGAKPGIHEDTGQLYYINEIRGSNTLIMIEENN